MLQRLSRTSSSNWLLIGLLLCCVALSSLSAASVQAQASELAVRIDGFSSQDWPQAQTILTVLDANGKPVEGLTQSDVRAQVDGTDVAVTSVSRGVDSNLPSFVVLGIDASAGMAGAPLDQAKLAAHQFVDALGPQDSVAILAYSDAPNLVQSFTQDRAAAHAAIDSLTAGGGNGLYRAATQGVLLGASSAQTGRRALVLLSSAVDDTQADPRQSLVAAQGLGVPVFIVGLGGGIDRPYLQQLTDAGGGRFTETLSPDGLIPLYHDVSELLRNQYVVNVDASALDLETSRAVTLRMDVIAGESSGGAQRIVCPANVCATFRELLDGARLTEAQVIGADILSSETIESVSLVVDGQVVGTVTDAPYEFTVDPAQFTSDEHTFSLSVTTSSGKAEFGQLSVLMGANAANSSFGMMPLLIVALVAVIVLLAMFFFLRRRKRGGEAPQPESPAPEPVEPVSIMIAKNRTRQLTHRDDPPPPPPVEMEPVLGYLKMTDGPLAGQTFAVGAKPVSIGSGNRCEIQLPAELDGSDVPSEFARVWIRADQLMVHEIRRLTAMGAVGGQWEILSNHDTFAIGPCVFRFDLDELAAPTAPEPIPNVLRDKSPEMPFPAEPRIESPPAVSIPAPATPATETSIVAESLPIARTAEPPTSSEPIPNIFRDKTEEGQEDAEEPAIEQAAG